MKRLSVKQVRAWIAERPESMAGFEIVSRNGYYAIERNNGSETMWTGSLSEVWACAYAYSQGYCDAKTKYNKEGAR